VRGLDGLGDNRGGEALVEAGAEVGASHCAVCRGNVDGDRGRGES
jgi:hypothetical protein